MERLILEYPWLQEIYKEIAMLRHKPEETMHLKIGIIVNTDIPIEAYKKAVRQLDCEFIFQVGALDAAIDIAVRLQDEEHVDAIITMMATSRVLKEHVSIHIPVIPMNLKGYDVLSALWYARNEGNHPGFVEIETQTVLYDFHDIVRLLGFDVKRYAFRGFDHMEELAKEIRADGCDVITTMGTRTSIDLREYGINTFLFTPSVESFLDAVEEVRRLYEEQARDREMNQWLNTIVNEIDAGIITWDRDGKIILFNNQAQKTFRRLRADVVGKRLKELLEEIPQLAGAFESEEPYSLIYNEGQEYLVSSQKLDIGQVSLGGMLRITDVKDIQNMELQARRSRSETGFVATAHFSDIQGNGRAIMQAKNMAKKYARSDAGVMIYGESGCGKELFAQSIHNYSSRWNGPFVAVNCSAFADSLLESELFGYEEGAFTGAKKKGNPGLFEMAHGGTMFLDEVGEMPLHMQSKLLRVLQERTVRRIGGNKNIPLNVRFIFATNRNLAEEVKKGTFRADLYYRINVLPLYIPPLRERPEDIPRIAEAVFWEILRQMDSGYQVPVQYLENLKSYHWPGNVRELRNVVERMIVLEISDECGIRKLLKELQGQNTETRDDSGLVSQGPWPETPGEAETKIMHIPLGSMESMEHMIIDQLLERFQGDRRKVEKTLEISRSTLWRYLKKCNSPDS